MITMDTSVNLVRLHLWSGSESEVWICICSVCDYVIIFYLIVRIAKFLIRQIFIQAISDHFAKFNGHQNFPVYGMQ